MILEPLQIIAGDRNSRIHFGEYPAWRAPPPTAVLLIEDGSVPAWSLERARAWLGSLGVPLHRHVTRGGEEAKQISTWLEILELCHEHSLDRASVLAIAGGGALADVGGFAAAAWLRGIRWIGIPTTLLGMVDAHLGGKTAIQFAGIKNRIGAFHLPDEVIIDPELLAGLPVREIRSGWGEILKSAIVGDAGLYREMCQAPGQGPAGGVPSLATIRRVAAVKVALVNGDFRDHGARQMLNLGHTLAHALEVEEGSRGISHGEAVAAGIRFAAEIALDLGLTGDEFASSLRELLARWDLRRAWAAERADELWEKIRHDKKMRGGALMILPVRAGECVRRILDETVIRRRLREGPREP